MIDDCPACGHSLAEHGDPDGCVRFWFDPCSDVLVRCHCRVGEPPLQCCYCWRPIRPIPDGAPGWFEHIETATITCPTPLPDAPVTVATPRRTDPRTP